MDLAAQGYTDKEIASRLGISRETVGTYWKRMRQRLGVNNRTEVVAKALKHESSTALERITESNRRLQENLAERIRYEEQLTESLTRLQEMLDNLDEGVLFVDENRRVLFCNQRFVRIFAIPREPQEFVGFDLEKSYQYARMLYADADATLARIEELVAARETVRGELVTLRDGRRIERDFIPIRYRTGGHGYVWLFRDTTERLAMINDLERRVAFERTITQVIAGFINCTRETIDAQIDSALERVGRHVDADRTYIFVTSRDGAWMSNTHEWTMPGISSEMTDLQKLNIDAFPWLKQTLFSDGSVVREDLQTLPATANAEREEWERQGIKSIALFPLRLGERTFGMVGFDAVRQKKHWSESDRSLLLILAEVIASALERTGRDNLT